MKLVKEILYEKFSEESDPIQDLGIGGFSFSEELQIILKKFNPEKKVIPFGQLLQNKGVQYYWKKRLEDWFLGKSVTGIFAKGNDDSYGSFQKYTTGKITRVEIKVDADGSDEYSLDYLNFALIEHKEGAWFKDITGAVRWPGADEIWWYYLPQGIYRAKLSMEEKIYVNEINEKFSEQGDPLRDMGIGPAEHIKNGIAKLQKEPGVGVIGIEKHADLDHITIDYYGGPALDIEYLVKKYIGNEFFKLCGSRQHALHIVYTGIIKPEYVDDFKKAFGTL